MLKNKINILGVMFLFSVVYKNSYAMDRAIVSIDQYDQDEPALSAVLVNVSPLFPSMPAEFRVCVDNHLDAAIAADFTPAYFSPSTGRVFTSLRLVNKEMNEYFKRDDVLHEKTFKIKEHKLAKRIHLGEIRALIEGSKTKRMQHQLYECNIYGDYGDNFAALGLGEIDNHKLDQRYYSNPDCFRQYCRVWNLIQNDGLALINICKKREAMFLELQKRLLALPGISERARDTDGITALMWTIEMDGGDQDKTFNIFEKQAAKGICVGVNFQDKNGDTVLMRVAKKLKKIGYFTDYIRFDSPTEKEDRLNLKLQNYLMDLAHMGADFYIPDNEGIKPFDVISDISLELAARCKVQCGWYEQRRAYSTSAKPEEFLLSWANDIIERSYSSIN